MRLRCTSKQRESKSTPSVRLRSAIDQMRMQEVALRSAKAVSKAKRGRWPNLESVEQSKNYLEGLVGTKIHNNFCFIVRANDVLPTPTNLI